MQNKKSNSIDEYIKTFPKEVQIRLRKMREVIRAAAPEAEERISYQMPAYWLKGVLVYFAAFKNHIGFYPTGGVVEKFQKELARYKSGKGSVQFPLDEPLPVQIVSKIVKFRVSENLRKDKLKTRGKG